MHDFLQHILYLLERGLIFAVAAVLAGAGVLFAVYRRHRRENREEKFPWGRAVAILMLVGYLAVVFLVTVLRQSGGGGMNLHLFLAWREAWNKFTLKLWLNILLNIGLFVPLGVLLPLIGARFRKWCWMLAGGFGLSLFIEVAQMFSGNLTDVDDLFNNTLGAMLGWCAVMLVLHLAAKKPRQAASCLVLPLAAAAVIGGIFLAYDLQEFGNLEEAPAFRADTAGIEWELTCGLAPGSETAPVYYLEPYDKESADAFGRTFFDLIGKELVDVYYYDNQSIMGNHSGGPFLDINWLDRTWDVSGFEWEGVTEEVDEEGMRQELSRLGITVPEGAEFTWEGEGKATLRADRLVQGGAMVTGFIERRVDGMGEYALRNCMVTYHHYRDAEILTPEEAYALLQRGDSSAGYWFEHYGPETVEVTACSLHYRVDSKGFYQPVYVFELTSPQAEYGYQAVVPALG